MGQKTIVNISIIIERKIYTILNDYITKILGD